ncbi:MAG: hypothetical protein E6778_14330 [Niallia nealsonii]|nr:hypothetical protein [Niallia nealsonii]
MGSEKREINCSSADISQNRGEIGQTRNISAKVERKSAKLGIYQPKRRGNQPNWEYISQREGEISQRTNISAKEKRKSAKVGIYQPKRRENQPTHKYIS